MEGILDLMISKSWAIKLATEAARTVLSVDQIIVARQAGGPKPPGPNPVSHCFPPELQPLLTKHRTGMKTN
jgi:T-complex protein 1 subunit theta